MRIHSLCCTLSSALLLTAPCSAQEPIHRDVIALIRSEAMDHSRVLETFNHLTNVIGARLTGSPAYKEAVDYARARLAAWGMSNVRVDPFPFGRGWSLEKFTLELAGPRYFPLTGFPEAWTPSVNGVVTGTPIYLGDKTAAEIEAMGDKLRGAIVLAQKPQTAFVRRDRAQPADVDQPVRSGAPPAERSEYTTPLNTMRPLLHRFGVAAVLRASQGEHGTIFVQGGNRNTPNDATPSVIVVAEQYNMVVNALQSGVPVQLRLELKTRYHEADTNSYNVLAEIPGEDPAVRNEVVLIGAHLDSWHTATGATDNADASAAMMEAMRILKAIGVHPRRTIRLALWGGEEQGLLGSKAYATKYLDGPNNTAARDALAVYLNDDPGTGPTYGFYMQDNAPAKAIFDAWLEPLKDLGMKRNVIGPIGSTDHLSFTVLGVPGFTAIKDYATYDVREHHTNADFFERVDEAGLKQSAIVMAVFAYHAAMRDAKIPRLAPAPAR
jgi:carboxypeptidase Q